MRIDVVTIFPDYLEPLRQSLPGKAIDAGIVDLRCTTCAVDTRRASLRRRLAVRRRPGHGDEGAGVGRGARRNMLGGNASRRSDAGGPAVHQADRQRWSGEPHLVFACGRYEGIDQRVIDDAARRMRVEEVSIGDYVLPGGESAALVMIEAVVRLLPDVLGNPASHQDDSHSDGLLEGPSYTRPPSWRGLDVPEVLLSGDHAKVAAWRREQAAQRTRERRPDLLDDD